jgi:hypothetical protein
MLADKRELNMQFHRETGLQIDSNTISDSVIEYEVGKDDSIESAYISENLEKYINWLEEKLTKK